jgi:hypothetical protein
MSIRRRMAAGAVCLVAIGGATLTTVTTADAGVKLTRIDVGKTIRQGGYWKGSGSYVNGSGLYARVCVSLWKNWPGPDKRLSQACRVATRGSRAFSAPSVKCKVLWGQVNIFTKVEAFDANNKRVAVKNSNKIGAARC